ncbi:MAG: PH domain-containing protein [Planctomycetota bacterium]|nr:PH domain-containing protein [Planctomycetota bacterium]
MSTKFIVSGTNGSDGTATRRVIEADTAEQAAQAAKAMGMTVESVQKESQRVSAAAAADPLASSEQTLWEGTPSQWSNFWWFVAAILIIPIPWTIWKWLSTRMTRIRLTSQRLQIQRGVLTRALDELELYRVKDTQLTSTLIERMVGLGTVSMLTSDISTPAVTLTHIPGAEDFREKLRSAVESVRRVRGVREIDVGEFPGQPAH